MGQVQHIENKVVKAFMDQFGYTPLLAKAPGRINIIGEHIDYNDGLVLPMAIDQCVVTAMGQSKDQNKWVITAMDVKETVTVQPREATGLKGWQKYVVGMLEEMYKSYDLEGGLDIVFSGNVPLGAGLSSSAALEVSVGAAVRAVFNLKISDLQLAKLCQWVEQQYAGTQCGIMDQYASVFGQKNKVMRIDCQNLSHLQIPLDLGTYVFLLCNSGVDHELASSGYNDRRADCEQGLELIKSSAGVQSFRQVQQHHLDRSADLLGATVLSRCRFVVEEIARVEAAVEALQDNDLGALGDLLYASHTGLRDDYQVSCQELDYLVDLTRAEGAILGSRMMGGGFGGCTLNLIEAAEVPRFVDGARIAYRDTYGRSLETYVVKSSDGVCIIS